MAVNTQCVNTLLYVCLLLVTSDLWASSVDPTKPFFSIEQPKQAVKKNRLVLQAIYIREDSKEAVINNIPVQVGDRIEGVTITRIESDKVHYIKSTKSGVLMLNHRFLKKTRVGG